MIAFLFITCVLGGGAAWMTGRSVALSWSPPWLLWVYAVLLAGAARFLDYALAGGELLSMTNFARDIAVLAAVAFLGHRTTRASQMTLQYPWLFEKSGPLSWRSRNPEA